jgi:peptidoglycan/xylan/chitin deacetylase (PgdA/CDA1 family)
MLRLTSFLPLALFLVSFLTSPVSAQQIAITMDDFRLTDDPMLSPKEKDERILDTLAKNEVEIALFVIGSEAERPLSQERLAVWDRTNHIIANHTYAHRSYNNVPFQEFAAEIVKTDALLSRYKNFQRYFRFPLLKEGNTLQERDEMRAFLKAHGYKQGYVTIDASDWYVNSRLIARLRQNPQADIKPYRDYYLQHLWDRAQFYDDLSRKVLARSIKHTLLIHHNLLNALFLNDVLEMFRNKGWTIISAREAFQDPVFQKEPNIVPAGESLVWALAKETGKFDASLRYPGEDSVYEEDAMDKLGL